MNGSHDWLLSEKPEIRSRFVAALNQSERNELEHHWEFVAREAQLPPPGAWRTWLILAGRGFGKTRAGAEWVQMIAERNSEARVALVSSSLSEARAVMVEGESGVLNCSPPERSPVFEASLRRVRWPNGAQAQLFSAAEPESLRGPQFSHAYWTGAEGILHQSGAFDRRCTAARGHRWVSSDPAGGTECRRLLSSPGQCGCRLGWARRPDCPLDRGRLDVR